MGGMDDDPREGDWLLPWHWTARQWTAAVLVMIGMLVVSATIFPPLITRWLANID